MLTKTDVTQLTLWRWRYELLQMGFDRGTTNCLMCLKHWAMRGRFGGPSDGATS